MANKPVTGFNEVTEVDGVDLFHLVASNVDKKIQWSNMVQQIDEDLVITGTFDVINGNIATINTIIASLVETVVLYEGAWSTQTLANVRKLYYYLDASDSTIKTINLNDTPVVGDMVVIKDKKGDAAAFNITVNGNGKQIDGSSSILINVNHMSYTLKYDGEAWNLI
jgi:hypothetical protein